MGELVFLVINYYFLFILFTGVASCWCVGFFVCLMGCLLFLKLRWCPDRMCFSSFPSWGFFVSFKPGIIAVVCLTAF